MRDRYLKVMEDKDAIEKIEAELDMHLAELEKQKKEIFADPQHSEYAYVTYEDLENLPIWHQNSSTGDGSPE